MVKSFREWLSEGEAIYVDAIKEYESLQAQIERLEEQLAQKRHEVNQVAQMINKPTVDGPKKVAAQLVEHPTPPQGMVGSVTRALTGRPMVARAT